MSDEANTPHCLSAAIDEKAKKVVLACEKHWERNKADCNHFLKAVADELKIEGFNSGMDADGIVAFLETPPAGWTKLSKGDHVGARAAAIAGKLVIAGLKSTDMSRNNGHVAVVTAGDAVPGGDKKIPYPRGYWGVLNNVGAKCTGLNFSFPAPARETELRYYAREI